VKNLGVENEIPRHTQKDKNKRHYFLNFSDIILWRGSRGGKRQGDVSFILSLVDPKDDIKQAKNDNGFIPYGMNRSVAEIVSWSADVPSAI